MKHTSWSLYYTDSTVHNERGAGIKHIKMHMWLIRRLKDFVLWHSVYITGDEEQIKQINTYLIRRDWTGTKILTSELQINRFPHAKLFVARHLFTIPYNIWWASKWNQWIVQWGYWNVIQLPQYVQIVLYKEKADWKKKVVKDIFHNKVLKIKVSENRVSI